MCETDSKEELAVLGRVARLKIDYIEKYNETRLDKGEINR